MLIKISFNELLECFGAFLQVIIQINLWVLI
jgi:hypothetical protein